MAAFGVDASLVVNRKDLKLGGQPEQAATEHEWLYLIPLSLPTTKRKIISKYSDRSRLRQQPEQKIFLQTSKQTWDELHELKQAIRGS